MTTAVDVRTVQAELYRARDIESLDTASLRATTENGVAVHIAMSHVTDELFGPVMEMQCEKASVCWSPGRAEIAYHSGSTEILEDDATPPLCTRSFLNMIAVLREGGVAWSTLEIARAQTLCIDAAHESCSEIHTIPDTAVERVDRDGDCFRVVDGMDDLLIEGAKQDKLFSEMGVPWAVSTAPFDTSGYRAYPTNRGGDP